jgi:hypothetical protein
MRRGAYLAGLAALVLVATAAIGASAGAVSTKVGNLEFSADGSFSPKVLPKATMAPIALTASGKIGTTDGTHPPALVESVVETDKDGAINVKGLPLCRSGQIQATDTKAAEKACKAAIIGSGTTTAEIEFAESPPIDVHSKLLVINGGFKGGVTTLFIHAYFSSPVSGAIVTTLKISKIHKGPYGLKTVATIPKIAGGAGSVTDFSLKIDKKYTYKGKKVSVLTLKCPDGKVPVHISAKFDDGTKADVAFIKTCTGKG